MTYNPQTDGVDHIWLSPKGRTYLGQQLFIGANRQFVDPVYGSFASVYAFWLWLDSGKVDSLRGIHHDCMVRSSITGLQTTAGSLAEVSEVLKRSVLSSKELCRELRGSELPFANYEVIEFAERDPSTTIYQLPEREWYVRSLEELRLELKSK